MKSLVSVSVGGQKRKHIVAVWGTESNSAVFWSLYVSVCRISQQITTLTQLLTKYLYLVFQWWYKRAFFFFFKYLNRLYLFERKSFGNRAKKVKHSNFQILYNNSVYILFNPHHKASQLLDFIQQEWITVWLDS